VNVVWVDESGDGKVAASVIDVLTLREGGGGTHSENAPSHLKKIGGSTCRRARSKVEPAASVAVGCRRKKERQ